MDKKKMQKSIGSRLTHAYIRKIKKWMLCPACRQGKMTVSKKSGLWSCELCGYKLSADKFENGYVFWFCDECSAYLNVQEGFDINADRHICRNCGYENDITFDNIKGICADCGKTLPDPDSTLCADCRQKRRHKAKEWLITAGIIVGASAIAYLASQDGGSEYDADPMMRFSYVTDYWLETASEDELRSVEYEMRTELDSMDYDSDEHTQLYLKCIDVVNAIASRFPLNLSKREHGWYLPNDD